MHRRRIAAALAAASALVLVAAPAQAHRTPPAPTLGSPSVVTSGLAGPLSLAVDVDGTVYATQDFGGDVTAISRTGKVRTLAGTTGASGVFAFAGSLVYTTTSEAGALVSTRSRSGTVRTLADVGAYEAAHNPDGAMHYGTSDLPADCLAQWPETDPENPESSVPEASYTGLVDAHPYASVSVLGTTFVADAGANTIWKIDARGRVSTLAVLPAGSITPTADQAEAMGLPRCLGGHTYVTESVPTDVELGPDGWLYVSTLPGGPEDDTFGARGSVYKVSPWTGRTVRVATGFLGATDLAVTPTGDVYVAELFGDRVSVVRRGTSTPVRVMDVPMPGAVEWTPGALYVAAGVFADGQVLRVPLR
ncbi:hypothetical protein CLV28_1476 [Sediminihabitans luteus]|uniref:ScyD/ScyE family protein n=1 Tax=Sediminihabitans luteus TaxID=1138585 RepID=A0A2M9CQ21_9CELL|nr:ScyD/ScyE family protein [Sediminihabitans luteus]PJJ73989.1 hypothetical protein CLV28_1476 [Sediminihabitans luteus]GII98098.1 hypothetical protein Slu03_04760 [Sediminihabitans luteus]